MMTTILSAASEFVKYFQTIWKENNVANFKFGKRSLDILDRVHPDIRAVALRAIAISEIDFAVVQGLRTQEEQYKLFGQGRTRAQLRAAGVPERFSQPNLPVVTKTTKSNHMSGRAIDVAPYVNGKIEWDDNGRKGYWPKIASAMKTAAHQIGVKLVWGGDWKTFVDRPHFELA